MTYWWDRTADHLLASVRVREVSQHVLFPQAASKARTSVIQTREDVVLLVSLLSSVNCQLSWIVRLLVAILLALVCVTIALWH
jgi:short subunit fatty acids transporter